MAPPLIQSGSARQTTYRRLAAFFAMLAVALIYRADYLSDWDSWDYAAQAMKGHSSDLLLGRWWFIAIMRGCYLLSQLVSGFGSGPEQAASDAVLAMQTCSAIMMALALVAMMAWTYRLTKSVGAELLVAVLILPGPLIGIYASSVMTESLTVLMLSLAFLAWEAAIGRVPKLKKSPGGGAVQPPADHVAPGVGPYMLAFLAGCAFGVAIDVREPAALFCAWPIISCLVDRPQGRWGLLTLAILGTALTLGLGVLGGWAWYPWMKRSYVGNIVSWTAMMSNERKQFSVSLMENLHFLWKYATATNPVFCFLFLPALVYCLVRRSRLAWMALACVPYTLSLLMNHDLGVNPRFLIPLVWVLMPMIAGSVAMLALQGKRLYRLRLSAVTAVLLAWGVGIVIAQWGSIEFYYFRLVNTMHTNYQAVLRDVPDGSTLIPGPSTPVVMHINRIGLRSYDLIESGWSWPDKELLKAKIARRLALGRNVFININEKEWNPEGGPRKSGEWETLMDAIEGCQLCPETYPMVRILPASAPASAPDISQSQPASQAQERG